MARSDKRTQREAVEELYSDFPIDFGRNPVTGSLGRMTNEESVKSSIRNIVLVMSGEWPHTALGSRVYRRLFENIDPVTADDIRTSIVQAIHKYEPRADIVEVRVMGVPQEQGFSVDVHFRLVNRSDVFVVSEVLKRVR
jgi:phage baseplate assembly protein W